MKGPEPPGRGMSFAERQLRRHGWRRGQGLGKRQDGIAEAIRVKVKCDTAGVGHDAAEAFTFHWWDHVFNQAAANISVESGQDGISMRSLSEQGAHISNRKPCRAGRAGTMLYGRFVKSATLTACGEQPTELPRGSSDDDDDDDKLDLSSVRRLTDAELVQVCGGRTAHKGARHGLTMSAKLARLEEQERAFLATYRQKEQQQEPPGSSPAAERQEKRRKKRKHSRDRGDPEELQSQQLSEEEVMGEEGMVMKRKKKKKRRKNQEVSREEEVVGEKGKVAKRKQQQEENEEELAEAEMEKKSKKKKKKKKEEDKEELAETEVPLEDTDQAGHCPRKKRKRRKEAE